MGAGTPSLVFCKKNVLSYPLSIYVSGDTALSYICIRLPWPGTESSLPDSRTMPNPSIKLQRLLFPVVNVLLLWFHGAINLYTLYMCLFHLYVHYTHVPMNVEIRDQLTFRSYFVCKRKALSLPWASLVQLVGWAVSTKDLSVTASPVLGLFANATMSGTFPWVLMIELKSWCLYSKNFISWGISSVPSL